LNADCKSEQLRFQGWGAGRRREVRVDFEGGLLSSDGGSILLAEAERRRQILRRFAACFVDHRSPERVEHSVASLVSQRVFGLALGYEDVNDHEQLRADPLLATAIGAGDPTGRDRRRARDAGKPLAGKSTLNRFEHGAVSDAAVDRYKRIEVKTEAITDLLIDLFVETQASSAKRFILDLDATDDPVHGEQEGRFFHGYYGHYCFLPLYIACGDSILWAELRPSNIDAAKGSIEALERVVGRVRRRFPRVEILVRADSGFAREELMRWCEEHGVDYVLGLARNRRLERTLAKELARAARKHARSKQPERCFKDFVYETRSTWSRRRRVIGKAEVLARGPNPRFLVTSLPKSSLAAEALYDLYCLRGDMENRIKEQQLDLFAGRTSAHWMKVNQLRLWFSTFAYTLLAELRRLALADSSWSRAQCGTIRLKLLKIGAHVRLSVRRIWISLSSAYPWRSIFLTALEKLRAAPA
jgi:hypothetical protein